MAKKKFLKLEVGQTVHFLKKDGDKLTVSPAIVHEKKGDSSADLHVFTPTEVEFWKDVEHGSENECFCFSHETDAILNPVVESTEE